MLESSNIILQAAGLLALADLPPVVVRTALIGTASYSDALVVTPGMHHQQSASQINCGEFPITGAMTTGYIFRVENPATVHYLQRIGVAGHLVTAHVYPRTNIFKENTLLQTFVAGVPASLLYALCPLLTIMVAVLLVRIRDWWALGVLGGFAVSRLINVVVIKRRDERGWKGQKEPGVQGDLFILLCHDRWVRLQGAVDDLKAVASGQWLRDMTATESFAVTCATMLVYTSAALAFNASVDGSLLIALLLLSTVALLTLCNSSIRCLQICDRIIRTVGAPKKYERRLALANDLIAEAGGRNDWAVGMGLVLPKPGERGVVNV
ncbi:hypothetical protein IW261DRAFT_734748 [Armillaria novae-zelandiae]|uniref:Uncharacterized protein n=1 Tax=Armillaria novae-zelandiae TaxID=153914 RepID=A0AA39NVC6_9AGAR|nr:hypothetical protein IW261DRAFT_734748 [Armillaria novae-zelandiae]